MADGSKPALDWLRRLHADEQDALGGAMTRFLQRLGPGVCETEWGKWVEGNTIEFRYRDEDYLFRVYCFQSDEDELRVTNGYDKKRDSSKKREDEEIARAVARQKAWRLEQARLGKAEAKAALDERSRERQGPGRAPRR
jgi:hypothetical protein